MGMSSKDIATTLDIAQKTVDNHRNSLREKLGIKNKGINLQTYLMNGAIDNNPPPKFLLKKEEKKRNRNKYNTINYSSFNRSLLEHCFRAIRIILYRLTYMKMFFNILNETGYIFLFYY